MSLLFRVLARDGRVLDELQASDLASYNPRAQEPDCAGKTWQEADLWAYLAVSDDREQRPGVYS